ncbi:MAG: AAA family ATPase, partial [Bdellovibrionales bacterium]|nr:AAA family ATPase [Bdellovibrionales bacterium]
MESFNFSRTAVTNNLDTTTDFDKAAQSEQPEAEVFFRGTVTRITYRNRESGFGVLRAEADPGIDPYSRGPLSQSTLVGVLPADLAAGASIIARGQWQTHPKFGRQFKAWSLTEADPTGVDAIAKYLGSGAVKGFGPTLAQRVVEAFGENTLKVLDETPEKLIDVPGIGEKKLSEIIAAWQQKRNLREVLLFFQNHGISLALGQRIYNAYGDRAIEKVSDNPYLLAREVWGIGFQTADRIASALGVDPASPERMAAGVAFALNQAADDGHCYLPRSELVERAGKLLQVSDPAPLERGVTDAMLRGELTADGDYLYAPPLYQAETHLARDLAARAGREQACPKPIASHLVQAACEHAVLTEQSGEGPKVIRLSEQQQHAVRLAADHRLLVITGGPGCGKTTLLRTLARLFRQAGLETKLAAPTGRAAQRMAEVCGMPASTIHRLLKYDPMRRDFSHNEDDPLELDALIIDESSMIDVPLAASLLAAVPPDARLVIVGDADQLPSVGPGLFLGDVLRLDVIPRICLTTLFRRADESSITGIAHQINSGLVPSIPEPDGETRSDAYFLPVQDSESAAQLIERLVTEQIPKKFGLRGSDITVLTPMNQGPLGVVALNQRLQKRMVPHLPGSPQVHVGELSLRCGDRVCQRVNNYQLHANGVFNGDQGTIIGVDLEERCVFVELWDGRE